MPLRVSKRCPGPPAKILVALPLASGNKLILGSPKNSNNNNNDNNVIPTTNKNKNKKNSSSNINSTEQRCELHSSPWSVAEQDNNAPPQSSKDTTLNNNNNSSNNNNNQTDTTATATTVATTAKPRKTKATAIKRETIESLSGDLIMAEVFPYLTTSEKVNIATATHTLYAELDSFAVFFNDHEWAFNEAAITKHFGKTGLRQIGNKWKAAGLVLYSKEPALSSFTPLIDFRFVQELCIHDSWIMNDLKALSCAKNLQMFKMSYPNYPNEVKTITSLDCLSECKRLREITISHAKDLTDVSALSKFGSNLEDLNLWNCRVESLEGIQACVNLITLNIHTPNLHDLQPLIVLKALETVGIHGCGELRDVSPLGNLSGSLKSVMLQQCWKIHDVSPLLALDWECVLELKGCTAANDSFAELNIARKRRQRTLLARKFQEDLRGGV